MNEPTGKTSATGLEIAVIGMSGRFPGAKDIDAFWENLKRGEESIVFFSDEELLESGISAEILEKSNHVKAKGLIEDIGYFDSTFFKYTPREAGMIDPQLRIFHECAWHALEDAGYDPLSYKGLIGLYAGYAPNISWNVGHLLQSGKGGSETFELMNLNSQYFTTQICYRLNLRGPGVSVNTACSTSLVAIHLACRALLTGETDIALAGGVTIPLPWKGGYFYQEGMILSPDGHCRPFDAAAKGTSSGSGIGIVVLKHLGRAVKDRDHIYAVVKGSAINNDGNRKAGYSALSVEGQTQVIRSALHAAEVKPDSITYIEAHGIGTPWGDPLEIEALKKAFSKTEKKHFCRLGFLKANIGHLDAAAGAAAFIKTVMILKHRYIPPAVNFASLSPSIRLEDSPFYIESTPGPWQPGENPLRAGVSCFGIGGSNAHVILEEWTDETEQTGAKEPGIPLERNNVYIIPLSAKNPSSLERMGVNLAAYIRENPHLNLIDAAYTLQVGRGVFNHRQLLVCTSKEEVIEGLSALPGQPGHPGASVSEVMVEEPPVVFMFPGPGKGNAERGLEIYNCQPRFRQEMDRCFDLVKPLLGYDIKEFLYPSDKSDKSERSDRSDKSDRSDRSDLVSFIFEYSLAKWLMQGGIKPRAMIGYGKGEFTAACLAGVFSLEDAVHLLAAGEKGRKKTIPLNKPAVPFISAVTGKWIAPGDAENPRYWRTHPGQRVPFGDGIEELKPIENAVFLEVGVGEALSIQARKCLENSSGPGVFDLVPPREGKESPDEYLVKQIGRLWLSGISFDWRIFYPPKQGKRVSLPGYPFDKLSYSIESPLQLMNLNVQTGEKRPGDSVSTLPVNRPNLKTSYEAPRNRVEEILVQMWEDLLGIRPIGIHDNVMELGADSLKVMTYVSRFKESWGIIIHITDIFESPTAAELAAYFSEHYPEYVTRLTENVAGEESDREKPGKEPGEKFSIILFDNLMMLKKNSAGAGNIFLVHEVSGDIGAYIEFSRLLDTPLNCWGVQARKLKHYKPQNRAIEEIAAVYVEKIKQIQPEGPYYLATWSGGGAILFEMALQMEQGDDELAFVGFIDCRGPMARVKNRPPQEFTLETEKNYLRVLFPGTGFDQALEMVQDINAIWPLVVKFLKDNPSLRPLVEQYISQDRMLRLLNFDGQRVEDIIQYQNKSRTFQSASDHYLPARKLRAQLHFFEGLEAPQDTPVLWHEYCVNPIIKHRMKGDHYTIFQQPLVKEFAAVFSGVLMDIKPKQ